MNRLSSQYEYMSLNDFEELLADKPADEKWERHYVLIERDFFAVDVHDRVEGGFFERQRLSVPQDLLRLPAIAFELPLAEIYRDVIASTS